MVAAPPFPVPRCRRWSRSSPGVADRSCCRCRTAAATIRADLLARSRLGRASLERLEDPLVDQLVAGAIDRGVGAVIARAPRAMIDVNRALDELAPGRHRRAPRRAADARARAPAWASSRRGSPGSANCGARRSTRPSSNAALAQRPSPLSRRACGAAGGAGRNVERRAAARLPFDAAAPGRGQCRDRRPPRHERRAVAGRGGRSDRPAPRLRRRAQRAVRRRPCRRAPRPPAAAASTRSRSRSTARPIASATRAPPGSGFDRVAMLFEALAQRARRRAVAAPRRRRRISRRRMKKATPAMPEWPRFREEPHRQGAMPPRAAARPGEAGARAAEPD